ncbi:MAG: hypothetical protein B6U69_03980 [Thermofilum sp. ex4484_15]|nr:MAG: hypothetical protein B6U69_03980 [Thermofilum sp. ex4484_15]
MKLKYIIGVLQIIWGILAAVWPFAFLGKADILKWGEVAWGILVIIFGALTFLIKEGGAAPKA